MKFDRRFVMYFTLDNYVLAMSRTASLVTLPMRDIFCTLLRNHISVAFIFFLIIFINCPHVTGIRQYWLYVMFEDYYATFVVLQEVFHFTVSLFCLCY